MKLMETVLSGVMYRTVAPGDRLCGVGRHKTLAIAGCHQ